MDAIRAKVAKFRTEVKKILPYFLGEVYGMIAIEEKRVGTMAVDEHGRMYYSPTFVEKCSIPQGRFTVCHETLHVALRHAPLARKILGDNPTPAQLKAWNWAADCVVNQILEPWLHEAPDESVLGPGAQVITYQLLGLPAKQTIVQYYELLMQQEQEKQEQQTKHNDPDHSGEGEDDGTEGDDDESEGEDDSCDGDGEREDDGDRGGDEQEGPADDGEGDEEGGEDGEQGGDEADGDGDDGDGEDGTEDARGDGVRSPGDGGTDSEAGDGDAGDESASDADWSPAGGGSSADGQPRDYEAEPDPSWADREYSLAKQLEAAIEEAERQAPGSVPGELRAAVNYRLRPVADPYDALRASVARAVASPVGAPDFTLRRLSRRQQPDGPRLRGVVKLTPSVVIVLDTSGSMGLSGGGYDRAERAMEVIAKGVRRLKAVKVVCFDTQRHSTKMVSSMSGFVAAGHGGTDMAAAIEEIDRTEKPDAILVVTDGETEWPLRKPRARTVIALVEAPQDYYPVPHWATTVDLTKGGGR